MQNAMNCRLATQFEPLPLDPIAFFTALILAPFIVTLMTFYLLVPIAALIIGLPIYLVIGTPVLLWMVGRKPPVFAVYAAAGFLVDLGLILASAALAPSTQSLQTLVGLALPGLIFAPLWAGCFAWLYRSFYKVRYASGPVDNPILKLKEMMR